MTSPQPTSISLPCSPHFQLLFRSLLAERHTELNRKKERLDLSLSVVIEVVEPGEPGYLLGNLSSLMIFAT